MTTNGAAATDSGEYKSLQLTSQEEEEEPEEAEGDVDLDEDVYGAAMFSFIFDSFEIIHATDSDRRQDDHDGLSLAMNIARLCFVFTILVSNYLLQGSMLYFIFMYVVLPTLHATQRVYQKYHSDVFVDGVMDMDKWDAFDEKEALCGIAFSNFFFMYAILCLWWCTMLKDVRMIDKLRRNVSRIEGTSDIYEMIKFGEDDVIRIKKIKPVIRALLYLGILLPKMVISTSLLFIGTVWLAATDNFADLILNAVALEFVIAIDELLFEAMLPATIRERIGETKLWVKPKKATPASKAAQVKQQYIRSLIYFLTVTIGVYLFMTIGQYIPRIGVLPNYAHDADCPSYLKKTTEFVCPFDSYKEECFPFG